MERRCARCKAVKHEDDFAGPFKSRKRKGSYCRACRTGYQHEHYLQNRTERIQQARVRKEEEYRRRLKFVLEYLRQHPCVDCGESDLVVLEFDHLGGKSFTVSAGMKTRSWAAVLSEIEKCEVVCVNCHRRRTAIRGGFRRLALCDDGIVQVPLFGPWGER